MSSQPPKGKWLDWNWMEVHSDVPNYPSGISVTDMDSGEDYAKVYVGWEELPELIEWLKEVQAWKESQ